MRIKKEYMVITFATTTSALAMERSCEEKSIPGRLIPVPREITAGCGLAWRIPIEEYEKYKEHIANLQISIEGQFELLL